jgi:hypothetical protein
MSLLSAGDTRSMSSEKQPEQVVAMSQLESGSEASSSSSPSPTPPIDEKALVRKIDMRVIPMLFIIYVAAFLDR